MRLKSLHLEHFRRVESIKVDLHPRANLFLGENAQGKTTILEAVSYLTTGRSFRTHRDRDCLRHGRGLHDVTAIEATFERQGVDHTIRAAFGDTVKSFWIDGKTVTKLGDLWGFLIAVVFIPSDLNVVHGGPTERRSLCDTLLARSQPANLRIMQNYAVALRERNALLRQHTPITRTEYDAYEEQMAEYGSRLILARESLMQRFSVVSQEQLHALTGREEPFTIHHDCGFPKTASIKIDTPHEELRSALVAYWKHEREHDGDRGYTRYGPHRADLAFLLENKEARTFASQGQSRSIVLALRLAEVALLRELTGEAPILLLDDVLGELDQHRTQHFTELLSQEGLQTLLTATDSAKLGGQLPIDATFEVKEGNVQPHGELERLDPHPSVERLEP